MMAARPRNPVCVRCGRALVGEDDQGWYYQVPVTDSEVPGSTFMDRVHECNGESHDTGAGK